MIHWDEVAKRLGFPTEEAMWRGLYLDQKLTFAALANRFGVAHTTIRDAIYRFQIPPRPRGGYFPRKSVWPDDDALLQELEGSTYRAIGERLKVSVTSVYRRVRTIREARAALEAYTPPTTSDTDAS